MNPGPVANQGFAQGGWTMASGDWVVQVYKRDLWGPGAEPLVWGQRAKPLDYFHTKEGPNVKHFSDSSPLV